MSLKEDSAPVKLLDEKANWPTLNCSLVRPSAEVPAKLGPDF